MYSEEICKKAASIYLKAADYVRTYGWQVKGMGKHGEPRCSMGALESAYPKAVWEKELSNVMYENLYETLGDISFSEFNLTVKSNNDVIKLFEKMAKADMKKSALPISAPAF